jgi:hypothetical protein
LLQFRNYVILCVFTAYCGILFPSREEAAYSNFRLWESLGFIIAYAYSMYLCATAKIYILLAFLVIGMAGYITIEWKERKKLNEKATQ